MPDRTPRRGGRWLAHRQAIEAIAWKYRTGSPWMDLPEEYGSWKGVYTRLRNWATSAMKTRFQVPSAAHIATTVPKSSSTTLTAVKKQTK